MLELSDLVVEVRDRDLIRRAQIDAEYLADALFAPRANGVGAWSLHLPDRINDEPYLPSQILQQEGAGLLVTVGGEVFMSGLVDQAVNDASSDDPAGWWTIEGYPDDVLIEDALAFPDPANADPTAQGKLADTRTGNTESLVRQFISANIGPAAASGRVTNTLWTRIAAGSSAGGIGPTRTFAPYFQNLMELCQQVAAGTDVLFRLVQDGTALKYVTKQAPDLRSLVRLDVDNDQVEVQRTTVGPPSVTHAVIGGGGQGANRTIVAAGNATASTQWRRRRETFIAASDSTDTVELQRQALTIVTEARTSSFQVAPKENVIDGVSPSALLGATITAVVGTTEYAVRVNQVALSVTTEGVTIGITLGDDDGTDWEGQVAAQLTSLDSRLSGLERAVGAVSGAYAQAGGSVSITVPAGASASAAVIFPVGLFTVAPLPSLLGESVGGDYTVSASGRTAAGMTLWVHSSRATSMTLTVHWTALQMTATTAAG